MAVVVRMPKLSDTMEEGAVASWLKNEGDTVEEGEPLVEIETDKATMEYASPEEGVLLKILVKAGENAALQAPIAVFGQQGEDFSLEELIAGSSSESAAATDAPESSSKEDTSSPVPSLAQAPSSSESGSRVKVSPLARRMASAAGIDLASVQGSGPGGRIVKRDIESFDAGDAMQSVPTPSSGRGSVRLPLSMMRKTIAKRLTAGKNEAPHFYLTTSASMERVAQWRAELNQHPQVAAGELPKVSVNDVILLACSRALQLHPAINSSWQGDHILQHEAVHMAMAVATPTGLITPVVRDCDRLGVREIARTTRDLAVRAKAGSLDASEYTGGTFTVSNLGMTVVDEFTAIINPPQACILAVGRTQQVPHVDDRGSVVAQLRMNMTLSCDHRVVDGMVGAQFLETLIRYLESPLMMLA